MIAAVVLAAGSSSRFGATKQLLDLGGRPLVRHAVDTALEAGLDQVVVVVGHDAERVTAALPEGVTVVANPDPDRGLSSSLRAGLDALGPEVVGAVVLMADQPGVSAADVQALVTGFGEDDRPAARLRYEDGPGPAVLGRDLWPEVRALTGDIGARAVLDVHPEWVLEIAVPVPAPPDIDTPEDRERIRDP